MPHCHYNATSQSDMYLDCDQPLAQTTQETDPPQWWTTPLHVAEGFGALLVVFFIFSLFVKIADQWERAVVLRLGKFQKVAGPGIFFMTPFVETVAEWVSIKLQVKNVKAEKAMTKDTVPVNIQAVVTWKVTDPRAAVIDISDYEESIERIAQVMLREVIGACDFTQLLSNREEVDTKIKESIASKTVGWGIEIQGVDIQDVEIPDALQEAMSREAQAERERHARIILGQSEVDIAKQLVEAAKIYEQDPVAIQLRAMNIIYETTKERGSTILIPTTMADAMSGLVAKSITPKT